MLKRITKELKKGQIIPGTGHYQLNLLCVPKKDGATGLLTGIRVARHGSYSHGQTIALNDAVTDAARRMKLPNFTEYVKLMYPYSFVSLRDLKDAFRQLLLSLSDREYVQYSLFALKFRDLRVAYGEAGAAACCQDFSLLIIWICENKVPEFKGKRNRMRVHVDDFIIAAYTATECKVLTDAFDRLCAELGVTISVEKNEDCIQRGVVHGFGFKLDTPVKTVFVPTDKACDLVYGCLVLLKCELATGSALESLMGKIMHWSKLKKRAKCLCNRGIRQIHQYLRNIPKYQKQYTLYYVSEGWRSDIALFLRFFLRFREVSMASIIHQPSLTISASTDASSSGGAFVCANRWYGYRFSDEPNCVGRVHSKMHINMQEAHAVIMMIHHCRKMLTGRRIWLLVDNTTCMYGIINAWSSSPAMMNFVQEIMMLLMEYCIELRVDYIPSEFNILPDLLSRGARDEAIEWMELCHLDMEEQSDVDYYDHLRIVHSPIVLPDWLTDLGIDLNDADLTTFAPKQLLKYFLKGFEPQ